MVFDDIIQYSLIGTFDGKGHEIKGLYINSPDMSQGLFGYVAGTIKNLGVVESFIAGSGKVGGIAGFANGSTFDNCYFKGKIICKHGDVGGVVGASSLGVINNCYNEGIIISKNTYQYSFLVVSPHLRQGFQHLVSAQDIGNPDHLPWSNLPFELAPRYSSSILSLYPAIPPA